MEIDIVAIGKSAVYLVEIKSSIEKVYVSFFVCLSPKSIAKKFWILSTVYEMNPYTLRSTDVVCDNKLSHATVFV